MDSDEVWRYYGRQDPFYGVLTHPRFRRTLITPEARAELYASGDADVARISRQLDQFAPDRGRHTAIDFGCGVGRILLPLARRYREAIGVDISEGMIAEARKAAAERNVDNIRFVERLDEVSPPVDLVHTALVLQHINAERGQALIRRMWQLLGPAGVLAIQFPIVEPPRPRPHANGYLKPVMRRAKGWVNARIRGSWRVRNRPLAEQLSIDAEPPMLMNAYPLNPIVAALYTAGAQEIHLIRSDSDPVYIGSLLIAQRVS